jgi:hypothetical protein
MLGDGPDVLLKDNLLGRRRTDHVGQPAQMRRSPASAALIANILAQEERLEAHLRRLEIFESIFPRPHSIPNGFILHTGNVPRPEIARAQEPGSRDRIPAISLDPVARLLGKARRGDHPPLAILLREIPRQPLPPGPRCVDQVQRLALGLPLPHELVAIALARAARAPEDHFGLWVLGHGGDGKRCLVNLQSDEQ